MVDGTEVPGSRKCRKCSAVKPLDGFYKDASGLFGRRSICRDCARAYCRLEENRLRHLENLKKNYNPAQRWKRGLKTKYGTTPEEIDSFMIKQNALCPICEDPLDAKFVVDHNHGTGKIRGLLHSNCNVMLGMARDSPVILGRAQNYLLCGGV